MTDHICDKDDRKLPIDRPCSACSAGDYKMEYHDHCPPFRNTVPAPAAAMEQYERGVAHAYSDATTPGFFRVPERPVPATEGAAKPIGTFACPICGSR